MSSSSSPCAACKCLRRKCTQECVFAPYFPPDNPQKFSNVHKVFGASNVGKLLNELPANQREDAVNSLAYEAEYRLKDPVYGCVGLISILQHKLKQVQVDLDTAKKELSTYIGPTAMLPLFNHSGFIQQHPNYGQTAYQMMNYNMQQPMMGVPTGTQIVIREPQQQQPHHHHQFIEAQQLAAVAAAAAREQEMLRNFEQPQQNDFVRYTSGGFDDAGGPVTATGFTQMPVAALQPSLALGNNYETLPYHHLQQQVTVAQEQEHTHTQSQSQSQSHPHQLQLQAAAAAAELLLPQQQLEQQQQQNQQQLAPLHASHSRQQLPCEEGGSIGPS